MRKLRTLLVKMVCALAGGLMLSACSSEEGGSQAMGGKGAVILDLAAETVFDTKTKAVDESTYLTDRPLADYKVKILDAQGHVVSGCEWKYSERPTGLIELSNGSYTVVASDGEEFNVNASTRNGIYMYGSSRFDVNSDKVAAVNVACKPACGKLVVKFGDTMATYFSDYAVHFSTQAAGENGPISLAEGRYGSSLREAGRGRGERDGDFPVYQEGRWNEGRGQYLDPRDEVGQHVDNHCQPESRGYHRQGRHHDYFR